VTPRREKELEVARLGALPTCWEACKFEAKDGVPELPKNGRDMHTFTHYVGYGTVGIARPMKKIPSQLGKLLA
jgi:hypothetical protein